METNNTINKTQIFNVIILDKSGSMNEIRKAAITGFNETLAGIKKAQEKYAETQEHYITMVAFCSCSVDHIYDAVPVSEAEPLKEEDYMPCCMTPLYDAMGITLTELRKKVKDIKDSTVVATIITDGYENASKEYDGNSIKNLVEDLKKEGWTFTYMGANQDSQDVGSSLNIRNCVDFDFSGRGTSETMTLDSCNRYRLFGRIHAFKKEGKHKMVVEDALGCLYTQMADDVFDGND